MYQMLQCCTVIPQFNPSYGSYVLYDDGGPAKNVKMKKYRGGGEKKADRNIDKEEFSAATSAATLQPKRNRRNKSLAAFNDGESACVALDRLRHLLRMVHGGTSPLPILDSAQHELPLLRCTQRRWGAMRMVPCGMVVKTSPTL